MPKYSSHQSRKITNGMQLSEKFRLPKTYQKQKSSSFLSYFFSFLFEVCGSLILSPSLSSLLLEVFFYKSFPVVNIVAALLAISAATIELYYYFILFEMQLFKFGSMCVFRKRNGKRLTDRDSS